MSRRATKEAIRALELQIERRAGGSDGGAA